ncbi:hypothetical protein ABT301_12385 [Streptomyces sp. NPDC000987]|uniref:hypothetical protein n=1 Tax=Streptomyces sp. NPDC000987 TaxID=3154374 RepID=UPI003319D358
MASDAIQITIRELISLVGVLEHAHDKITLLGNVDDVTIARASGVTLIPSLYARAGLTLTRGGENIPLLVDEVGLLEAAVINLESYEGNEVVLVAGYELLDAFVNRKKNAHALRRIHGILTFDGEAGNRPADQPHLP